MRNADFGSGLLRGYSKVAVDEFVIRVQQTLAGDRLGPDAVTPQDIIDASFPLVPAWLGYSRGDVDRWLDEAEAELVMGPGAP